MEFTILATDLYMLDMRRSIDNLDIAFLHLLAERMRVVEKILFLKKKQNLDISPSKERKEDLRHLLQISEQLNLERKFFQTILIQVFESALDEFTKKTDDAVMERVCADLVIGDLRLNLLNLEKSICHLLTERFRVVKRIGRYKKKLQVPPLDPQRWHLVLKEKKKIAHSLNLNEKMVEKVFNTIHQVALDIENIMD